MSPRVTISTTWRVLTQLRRDPRTVALILLVPCLLVTLLRFLFDAQPEVFNRVGGVMLGLFPFMTMFIVTSITMLRERVTGTLERLMTLPLAKLDLLLGYAIAFALLAVVQATIVSLLAFGLLDLRVEGSRGLVIALAVGNATLGMALGLFTSAFARTEFQAVQFLPALVFPQVLLCGLFVARSEMAGWLQAVSAVLPLTYAYDALARVTQGSRPRRVVRVRSCRPRRHDAARARTRGGDAAQADRLEWRRWR
jgi:ABC-2 type transport system permease protein